MASPRTGRPRRLLPEKNARGPHPEGRRSRAFSRHNKGERLRTAAVSPSRREEAHPDMPIHTLPWQEAPPNGCRHGAVSIGNFDGVHRGHLALLTALRRQAALVGGPSVALTFDP